MAQTRFARDRPHVSIDETLEVGGTPVVVRLQPNVFDRAACHYVAWRGLSWTIACEDVAEAQRLRELRELAVPAGV